MNGRTWIIVVALLALAGIEFALLGSGTAFGGPDRETSRPSERTVAPGRACDGPAASRNPNCVAGGVPCPISPPALSPPCVPPTATPTPCDPVSPPSLAPSPPCAPTATPTCIPFSPAHPASPPCAPTPTSTPCPISPLTPACFPPTPTPTPCPVSPLGANCGITDCIDFQSPSPCGFGPTPTPYAPVIPGGTISVGQPLLVDGRIRVPVEISDVATAYSYFKIHLVFDRTVLSFVAPADFETGGALEAAGLPVFCVNAAPVTGGNGVIAECIVQGSGATTASGVLGYFTLTPLVTEGCSLLHLFTFGEPDFGGTRTGTFTATSQGAHLTTYGPDAAVSVSDGSTGCVAGPLPPPLPTPTQAPTPTRVPSGPSIGGEISIGVPERVGDKVRIPILTSAPQDPYTGFNVHLVFDVGLFAFGGPFDAVAGPALREGGGSPFCAFSRRTDGVVLGCNATESEPIFAAGVLAYISLTPRAASGCSALHLFTYGPPDGGEATTGTFTVSLISTAQVNTYGPDITVDIATGATGCDPSSPPGPTYTPTVTVTPTPSATWTPTPALEPSIGGEISIGEPSLVDGKIRVPVDTSATVDPYKGFNVRLEFDPALISAAPVSDIFFGTTQGIIPFGCQYAPDPGGVTYRCIAGGAGRTTGGTLAEFWLIPSAASGCSPLSLITYGPPDGGDELTGTYTISMASLPQVNTYGADITVDIATGATGCDPSSPPGPTYTPTVTATPTPTATSTQSGGLVPCGVPLTPDPANPVFCGPTRTPTRTPTPTGTPSGPTPTPTPTLPPPGASTGGELSIGEPSLVDGVIRVPVNTTAPVDPFVGFNLALRFDPALFELVTRAAVIAGTVLQPADDVFCAFVGSPGSATMGCVLLDGGAVTGSGTLADIGLRPSGGSGCSLLDLVTYGPPDGGRAATGTFTVAESSAPQLNTYGPDITVDIATGETGCIPSATPTATPTATWTPPLPTPTATHTPSPTPTPCGASGCPTPPPCTQASPPCLAATPTPCPVSPNGAWCPTPTPCPVSRNGNLCEPPPCHAVSPPCPTPTPAGPPSPPEAACADVNRDGRVTGTDVRLVARALIRGSQQSRYDVNGDGAVTGSDLIEVLRQLGRRC